MHIQNFRLKKTYYILMSEEEKTKRINKLSQIRSSIKILPVVNTTRSNIESKMENRRKRRQSLALNPNDFDALDEEQKSAQALEENAMQEKIFEKYELGAKIGQGSNGVVRKCRHKEKNKQYAVKCMELNEEHGIFLKRNFKFIKKLNHPNIIKYKALYLDLQKRRCYLIMNYQTMPSLEKITNLTREELQIIMKQLFSVISYLHARDICHRDIKPDNILYDRSTKTIKLIDFGISKKFVIRQKKNEFLTITGTLYYRAPEMFLGSGYDEGVDMWAAGITLYKLIAGKTPFESEYVSDTIENITNLNVDFSNQKWQKFPLEKQLITLLLRKDRKERMTSKEALKHSWIQETPTVEPEQIHYDAYSLKFSKVNPQKEKMQNEVQGVTKVSLEIPQKNEQKNYLMPNYYMNFNDSDDDDDVLIEINSQGQEVRSLMASEGGMTPKQFDDLETPTNF